MEWDCSSREDKWRPVNSVNKVKVWAVLWAAWAVVWVAAWVSAWVEAWAVAWAVACMVAWEEWVVSLAKTAVWAVMVAAGEAIGAPRMNRYFDNQNDFKQ